MEENQNSPKKSWLLPASILVAALLISGSVIYSAGLKTTKKPLAEIIEAVEPAAGAENLIDDDAISGDPEAPVTIVVFSDYQCPFCGRFYQQTELQLRKEYIETGKAKMVYRDFAFLGPESQIVALAAQCAGEQGKYWLYHDKLYEIEIADGLENNGNLSPELMKGLAAELSLNAEKFNNCLDSQKYLIEIKKDYEDGVKAGVQGTPATFVNGELISGAQPYGVFKEAVDKF